MPVLVCSLRAGETGAPEVPAPAKRLDIAFVPWENQTGEAELGHWCHGTLLLGKSFEKVRAVRVLPAEAIRYALQQIGLRPGDPIDPNRARRMGEYIEAQRVIWGRYARTADQWQVTVRVLNVATGAASSELSAQAGDWFDVRDRLNEQILTELRIAPSAAEQEQMVQRWTRGAEALDWYVCACARDEQGRSAAEVEADLRQALAADPNAALAYCVLAAVLGTQGRLDQAEEAARQALQLEPDSAPAHGALGWVSMSRGQSAAAEAAFRRASQLNPDDAGYLTDLARICLGQRRPDEAAALLEKAVLLDRTNATVHALLANVYAERRQWQNALRELEEARRYLPAGVHGGNALSSIAFAYERLGKRPQALECHEETLRLARALGTNPDIVRLIEKRIESLKSTLTPTFIQASVPRRYTPQELDTILQDRLADSERQFAANPFACTEAMRRWALELTHTAETDLDKARAIFDALAARFDPGGPSRSRTAREVFDAWQDPQTPLVCMDRAVLFVALARAADVNAFFTSVTRMPDGAIAGHACAAVFAGGRTLLVDPTVRWFGAPHRQYAILDDVQATAALRFINRGMDDPAELAAYRAGLKLWPEWTTGQQALVAGLIRAGQVSEARQRFAEIPEPQSEDYEAAMYWSLAAEPALTGKDLDRAREYLLKSIAIWPGQSYAHFSLGRIYVRRHQLTDARTAFRACLRNEPQEWVAGMARGAIARINEEIGVEAAPDTIQPEPKSR